MLDIVVGCPDDPRADIIAVWQDQAHHQAVCLSFTRCGCGGRRMGGGEHQGQQQKDEAQHFGRQELFTHHDHTPVFSARVADSFSLAPSTVHCSPRGAIRDRTRRSLPQRGRTRLDLWREPTRDMGAERCNSSRTPGRGLGACQKLRSRKEAGEKIVVSHGNALPHGRLWKRAPLMWHLR
jgi:hypothetical protein